MIHNGRWSISISGTVEFKSQDLISDFYPHSHKAVSVWSEGPKKIFFFNLMLNMKNNKNDAVLDEICKKKRRLK